MIWAIWDLTLELFRTEATRWCASLGASISFEHWLGAREHAAAGLLALLDTRLRDGACWRCWARRAVLCWSRSRCWGGWSWFRDRDVQRNPHLSVGSTHKDKSNRDKCGELHFGLRENTMGWMVSLTSPNWEVDWQDKDTPSQWRSNSY